MRLLSGLRRMLGFKAAAVTPLGTHGWTGAWFGGRTVSGENVTPDTAMTIPAYFAAIRAISEDLAKLPLYVTRLEGARQSPQPQHPLSLLFRGKPNPEMTSFSFRETMIANALGWGMGLAEIVRNGAGQVSQLWPIHPSRVEIRRDQDGALYYLVRGDIAKRQPDVEFRPGEVFHLHGLSGDGIHGYSVARMAAESLGVNMAAQKFAASFFGNGSNVNGVLEHPNKLGDKAAANLRESWQAMYSGAENGNKVAILEEGMTYQRLGIAPDEAQFLESRQFGVEDVARWFRMPPHKLQHLLRATFSNIEHQSIEYVTDTLTPWATRWEQEADTKLLDGLGALTLRHDFSSLLRGDSKSRGEYYKTLWAMGAMTPNQIREAEGMNPGPAELDQYYAQSNVLPLDKLGQQTARDQKPAEETEPKPDPEPEPAPEESQP